MTRLWVEAATPEEGDTLIEDWILDGITGVMKVPKFHRDGWGVDAMWFCFRGGQCVWECVTEAEAREWFIGEGLETPA